jgi:hypothetical protein
MSIFGAILPSLISAGVGLIGGKKGQSQSDQYAQQMAQLAREPIDIMSPIGGAAYNADQNLLRIGLAPALQQQAGQLGGLSQGIFGLLGDPGFFGNALDPARISSEVERLRGIARPNEDALRASLRSQVYNRGRLGLGAGGGVTGQFFNPELASLEEAFARADMGRVDQATQRIQYEQQRQLGNLFGLLGAQTDILQSPMGLGQLSLMGRTPQAGLAGYGAAAARASNANDAFFGSLGQTLGGLDFGSLFGDSGGGLAGSYSIANSSSPMAPGLFF